MKKLIIITLFFTIQLLANYSFSNDKAVKIDMHGGKSDKLSNQGGFSKMNSVGLNGLSPFSIQKPKEPTKIKEKTIPELKDIELK